MPKGRTDVKNSYRIACPNCGEPTMLHILEAAKHYASARCKQCKTLSSFGNPSFIPPPLGYALWGQKASMPPISIPSPPPETKKRNAPVLEPSEELNPEHNTPVTEAQDPIGDKAELLEEPPKAPKVFNWEGL